MLRRACHVLLLVCLLLNGGPGAMASVLLPQGPAPGQHAMADAPVGGHAQAHCDGAPAADARHATLPPEPMPGPGGAPRVDCGGDGCADPLGCQCPCQHHVQALVPLAEGIHPGAAPGGVASAVREGHPAPLTPQHIRPPIA